MLLRAIELCVFVSSSNGKINLLDGKCCCCLSGRPAGRRKRKRKKKGKKQRKAWQPLLALPIKKGKRERKFGGNQSNLFFREIFLSQGEREREREGEIHLSLHATFINTLVTEEIYKARAKCNRSPHPTPFLRRARSAPSDLRTL